MKKAQFIIYISGISCSGKSSVEAILMEKLPGLYQINWDRIKKQLAGYDSKKHKDLIKQLAFGFVEVVCKTGTPMVALIVTENEKEYAQLEKIASTYDYQLVPCKFTAPLPVLLERFRARVKSVVAEGRTISMMDEKQFLEQYEKGFFVPPDAAVFDSSVMSPEEIVEQILTKVSVIT